MMRWWSGVDATGWQERLCWRCCGGRVKVALNARRCQPFGNARVIIDQPVQRYLDLNEGCRGLRERANRDLPAQ
jgi:hypothetical protein